MEFVDWQIGKFEEGVSRPAIAWRDREICYGELKGLYRNWLDRLAAHGVQAGDVVAVQGDYSPASISCLLALLRLNCVMVPLSPESRDQHARFVEIAEVDHLVAIDRDDVATLQCLDHRRNHSLLEGLRAKGESGLVVFTSGSTGNPKAILHSSPLLLNKFCQPRHCYRTVSFLLFDHIGGFNTLFYTMANLGCVVVPEDRSVAEVCRTIEKHRAELLPTTPSFLNLLLLGEGPSRFDLSSLKLITYGTEVMPERTLRLLNEVLPGTRFLQTYGLSEIGILRSKSASNDSLMVKIGGEDYETKVVDGTLRVRAKCSMLGYLNAPSPFDEEGWLDTGDAVRQEGEYYRILGRESEIINVGGQKVYPGEVEKVICELPEVIDVAVSGEHHLLLGEIVSARVQLREQVSPVRMKRRIAQVCKGKLQPFMVPTKVHVVTEPIVNQRFKKVRRVNDSVPTT